MTEPPLPANVVVLHRRPFTRDGRCPSCGQALDDTGCVITRATALMSNTLGLVALSAVACAGTPSHPLVVRLGASL